jgi:hypothetical protein
MFERLPLGFRPVLAKQALGSCAQLGTPSLVDEGADRVDERLRGVEQDGRPSAARAGLRRATIGNPSAAASRMLTGVPSQAAVCT